MAQRQHSTREQKVNHWSHITYRARSPFIFTRIQAKTYLSGRTIELTEKAWGPAIYIQSLKCFSFWAHTALCPAGCLSTHGLLSCRSSSKSWTPHPCQFLWNTISSVSQQGVPSQKIFNLSLLDNPLNFPFIIFYLLADLIHYFCWVYG